MKRLSVVLMMALLSGCSTEKVAEDLGLVDVTPPVITVNGENPRTVVQGVEYKDEGATAKDKTDGNVQIVTLNSVDSAKIGSYIVTYTATDKAGNQAVALRTVNVIEDTVAPQITLKGNNPIYVNRGTVYTDQGATATDTIDGNVNVAVQHNVDIDKVGTYTVYYTAVDSVANQTTATRTVYVIIDITPPVIELEGESEISIAFGSDYNDAGATAIDNVDGKIAPTITKNSVNPNKIGDYEVVYTASDDAGNESTKTRKVHVVEDVTPPTITLYGKNPMLIDVGTTYSDAGAIATDDLDPNIEVSVMNDTVDTSVAGNYFVMYVATDHSGNTATKKREVVVSDKTPPVITMHGSSVVTVPYLVGYSDEGAKAFDNVDGSVEVVTTGSVNSSILGSYTLTYTATDRVGNKSNATRVVIVATNLKKTGQTQSYDLSGNLITDDTLKDDGYYQAGVTTRFTRDDVNAIVTDHISGLMWQDNSVVVSEKRAWLSQSNYEKCSNDHSAMECYNLSGNTANTYCSQLVLGEYSDWRLPTVQELEGILNYSSTNPTIDSLYFQNTASGYYWTSSTDISSKDKGWYVYFGAGHSDTFVKSGNYYVRCVRSQN